MKEVAGFGSGLAYLLEPVPRLLGDGEDMAMRLAIHNRPGSFSDRWIEYCRERSIDFCVVNAYESHILSRVKECDALLWHINHGSPTDLLMGGSVLSAVEAMGKVVFPGFATRWHFNDKLAQKYFLEAVGAPLVPTEVFYDRPEALAWLRSAQYPLVGKLRGGAGSKNVRLLRSFSQARHYCRQAFGKGFISVPGYFADAATKVRNVKSFQAFWGKLKRSPRNIANILHTRRMSSRDKGYVLLQKFLPGNSFDIRVTVVGDRAWAFTRDVRKNDWRASGSGSLSYDTKRINPDCVGVAFETADAIGSQCMAFDFLTDADGRPMIVEMCFGFVPSAVYDCPGHWGRDLSITAGHSWPQDVIVDNLCAEVARRASGAT